MKLYKLNYEALEELYDVCNVKNARDLADLSCMPYGTARSVYNRRQLRVSGETLDSLCLAFTCYPDEIIC